MQMINIAICDDDVPMTATIESISFKDRKRAEYLKLTVRCFLTDRPLWKVFVRGHAMI